MKYGFIGCGNMGSALAKAISKTTKDLMLSDYDMDKAATLAKELGCSYGTNEEIISNCERIFLGVKPQVMGKVLQPLIPSLQEKKPTLISMAAGLTISKINQMAGGNLPAIRIMPNTPVAVGCGMILYCHNELVSDALLADFVADMKYAGMLDSLEEELIDAGCSLSGCGPAFMYMYIDALAKGAVNCGLPRDKAIKYAAATMAGAANLLLATGEEPDALKIKVCSPGGSTIEGVHSLEENNLYNIGAQAVENSYRRNKELSELE